MLHIADSNALSVGSSVKQIPFVSGGAAVRGPTEEVVRFMVLGSESEEC